MEEFNTKDYKIDAERQTSLKQKEREREVDSYGCTDKLKNILTKMAMIEKMSKV